ncbi:hypothetical protein J2Z19_001583 [Ensifer adhaerens]|uniref:Uncharacterized protein n=1 Tax=Ensifer adhaerens TaxID=106592 RepID=A0ACC5ST81_ENSAD|nr:hypothetical protein [Ensifer adhaerens]MBP1871871.1 hypothetical protein [Ensifer adhaerens]
MNIVVANGCPADQADVSVPTAFAPPAPSTAAPLIGGTASDPLRVFAKIFVGTILHCRKRQFSTDFGADFVR